MIVIYQFMVQPNQQNVGLLPLWEAFWHWQ